MSVLAAFHGQPLLTPHFLPRISLPPLAVFFFSLLFFYLVQLSLFKLPPTYRIPLSFFTSLPPPSVNILLSFLSFLHFIPSKSFATPFNFTISFYSQILQIDFSLFNQLFLSLLPLFSHHIFRILQDTSLLSFDPKISFFSYLFSFLHPLFISFPAFSFYFSLLSCSSYFLDQSLPNLLATLTFSPRLFSRISNFFFLPSSLPTFFATPFFPILGLSPSRLFLTVLHPLAHVPPQIFHHRCLSLKATFPLPVPPLPILVHPQLAASSPPACCRSFLSRSTSVAAAAASRGFSLSFRPSRVQPKADPSISVSSVVALSVADTVQCGVSPVAYLGRC